MEGVNSQEKDMPSSGFASGREGGQVRSTCNGSAPGFAQALGVGAQACSRAAAGRGEQG